MVGFVKNVFKGTLTDSKTNEIKDMYTVRYTIPSEKFYDGVAYLVNACPYKEGDAVVIVPHKAGERGTKTTVLKIVDFAREI